MPPSLPGLMRSNLLEVFGERDPARRLDAVVRTYTSDVVFADPEEVVHGHSAVHAKAGRLLEQAPGFVFTEAGPIYENHDLGHLAWNFGPPHGDPVVSGIDVCLVRDGLVAKIYTLITS